MELNLVLLAFCSAVAGGAVCFVAGVVLGIASVWGDKP